jgi:hypothetical protein
MLNKIGCGYADLIRLVQDRALWRAVVNTSVILRDLQNADYFVTEQVLRFPETLLRGVS